jgi:DNA-binding transcriptional ArsR family regulator
MESIVDTALKLKALSNPIKLEIVGLLSKSEKTADELLRELSVPSSTLRKYLMELVDAGLIAMIRAEGKSKYRYAANRFEIRLSPESISEAVRMSKSALTPLVVEGRRKGVVQKLRSLGLRVKEGKLTVYDAAEMMGLTYLEAYSILEENGFLK